MGIEALPLPPPPRLAAVPPPSIRAHLARAAAAGGDSCQSSPSPRSLLSRILQRGGSGGGGDGSGGGKFGCRVRLPRRYSSTSSANGDGAAAAAAGEKDSPARMKLVGKPPELPFETPRSSLGTNSDGKKKPEEEIMSLNLGLGASLVLLLSKGAVELNKMVELRAQMEALVSEIRNEKKNSSSVAIAAAAADSSSSRESDGRSTTAVKDPIARPAVSDDSISNCSAVTHRMEAELQAELSRLHCAGEKLPPLPQLKTTTMAKSNVSDSPPRSCVVDDDDVEEGDNGEEDDVEEEYDDEEEGGYGGGERSPPHGGVSARALERRLYEVLQKRQQERIVELEAALDATQRRLHDKEREVVWWRDAAKLVTHRRDDSRRFARS
uniref:Protein POLAR LOCALIZATION DURING ASYMMETRIC DIVISION AND REDISTRIBUTION n=1 Tax=Leersia perrieri TaxID=77586 RepID=A0A0D9WMM8_9ORYZ